MRVTRAGSGSAQTGTEYMLLISVVVIGVTYAAYSFVQPFSDGVNNLGGDVKEILSTGSVGGVGRGNGGGGGNGNGGASGGPGAPTGTSTGTGTLNNTSIVNSTLNAPVTREQQDMRNGVTGINGVDMTTTVRSAPPARPGDNEG